MHDILEQAARAFDVPIKVLLGHSRRRRHCEARYAVMYAARQRRWSLEEIGDALDGRDHTTIRWGVERAEWLASQDQWYAGRLAELLPCQDGGRT